MTNPLGEVYVKSGCMLEPW